MSDSPWVLGIASSHNGGACLLHGGNVVAAVQEERLLRRKRALHPAASPSLSIAYCLDTAQIRPEDLDAVVVCSSVGFKREEEDVYLNPQLRVVRNRVSVYTIPHHLGHAVAVYALSGLERAEILIVDGSGSPWDELTPDEKDAIVPADLAALKLSSDRAVWRETISLYSADRGSIQPLEKHISSYSAVSQDGEPDHRISASLVSREKRSAEKNWVGMLEFRSLGDMFGVVGHQVFGSFYDGPGKVMGLAPYGKPNIPVDEFFRIKSGRFEFGSQVCRRFPYNERWPEHQREYETLAASVQKALEEAVLYLCGRFPSRSHLCYAGGVALNSVANERILRESGFKDVFIMPAAEDSGTAIGAAYYGLWQLRGYSPIPQQAIDETGRRYSRAEITSVIERTPALCVSQPDDLVDHVAELLSRGNIVGWFRGGSELGPRSLGQRSIFCDPRKADMKHILNSRVKFREGFRPFAPMVRYENVHEWFDVEEHHAYSPFMLRVMPFREEKKELVPAVVHVDGTGRVQTVARQTAPVLHRLLTAFYERTGVPMLLNTSFNVAGEPIVETPKDAVLGFLYTGIDFCVVEEQLLSKLADCDPILDCPLKLLSQWATLSSASGGDCLRFEVPPLDGATQSVDSVHVSRAAEMDLAIYRSRQSRLKLITHTPWGRVLHALPGSAAHILAHVDGTRTGRQIYDRLCACGLVAGDPETALATFRRELGLLWRAGAVWFEAGNAAANLSLARSA